MKHDIKHLKSLSGGSIGEVSLVEYGGQKCVMKQYASAGQELLKAESLGLKVLQEQDYVLSPQIILETETFLLMGFLDDSQRFSEEEEYFKFGCQLAQLHQKVTHSKFGLDHDNFIGKTPQLNNQKETWSEFFFGQRLEPQLKWAGLEELIPKALEHCQTYLEGLDVFPSLCHGDLWSGNILWTNDGGALIDPAISFSHYEVDLAMTKLFGSQPKAFYEGHQSIFPLQDGWQKREVLYNLYHIINHYNLFGSSYFSQIDSMFKSLK